MLTATLYRPVFFVLNPLCVQCLCRGRPQAKCCFVLNHIKRVLSNLREREAQSFSHCRQMVVRDTSLKKKKKSLGTAIGSKHIGTDHRFVVIVLSLRSEMRRRCCPPNFSNPYISDIVKHPCLETLNASTWKPFLDKIRWSSCWGRLARRDESKCKSRYFGLDEVSIGKELTF